MNRNNDGAPGKDGAVTGRMRWIGAALVLLVLGCLVWQAMEAGRGGGLGAEAEDPLRPSMSKAPASVDEPQRARPSASAVRAALVAPPAAKALASDETEVCGLGRVKTDETGRPRDMAPIRSAARRVREQVLPTLLSSQDDVLRAAGLLMVALDEGGGTDGMDGSAARARDELASLAAVRGTPQVYAWAMRACQQRRAEGVCRMLSADQWARLEPANAMAWLQVAADAKLRQEESGVAEAMYRVSLATKSDARQGTLVGTVLAKLPPETDALSRVGFAAELARLEARAELPLVAASQHCGVNEVRDANRQQVCAAVADVLTKLGSTRAEAALGASIGERVGWSAERVAAAVEERDALAQMSMAAQPHAWSCNALAQALARIHETARQGELATMRNALRRSPESAAVLAKHYREAEATRVASAASAASASTP